ncbi:PREDICTED: uncharacterized protein LOC109179529 [Ipomoea nil]|uniref:uncharacterized protein LOC109179529 n=1 Tax=Ipomoea nil TaxID=35883 RepID=UPI0009012A40|nr:PREDICTED: uncharacterized protein LOC109179529 [Ipomoea nil]
MVGLKRDIIVALPVVYLIFASHSHVDASNNFCATAVDKQLCENTVKGATNWEEAITEAIVKAIYQQANASTWGNPACEKPYRDTEENLVESLEIVGMTRQSDEDKSKGLKAKLPKALTSLEDCFKILKDLKQDASAEKRLMHGAEQAIGVCLAVNSFKSPAPSKPPSYSRKMK